MKIYFLHFSKRFTALGFVVGLLLAFLWPNHVASQTTITFSYTGAMQTWVVPSGVNSVVIKASGAQGGNAAVGGTGGAGGYAEGTLAVTPGQVLNIFVGGQNGFNGGGIGGINGNNVFGGPSLGLAPSGGGATDVRVSGTALGDRVIVAGGGGGAGHNGTWIGCQVAGPAGNGGSGGSLTGGNGTFGVGTPCNCGGGGGDGGIGGTQATGGAAGGYVGSPNCLRPSWTIGQNGSLGQGGNGSTTFYNGTGGGGGGGGGYYGGGSGGSGSDTTPGGGGGGGSSYIGGVTAGVMTSGVRSGDGTLDITFLADILTCPTDLTVPACQTQAAVNAAFNTWIGSVQILAGCNDGVITTDVGAPPACGGTSTVTFTLTGNSCSPTVPVTCTANFTVEFPDDIVLTGCPPPAVQLRCNPNIPSCGIVPSPTVSGGCSTVLVCMESPITQFGCERTRTLTWTATDNCNQSSTCSTDYTWTEDTTPPVLSGCPPTEVNLGCNPTTIPTCAVVPSPTATDACGSGEVICADFGITVDGCLRTKTLYWSSIDLCNSEATCETTYTWTEDTTPPVLSGCPPTFVFLGCNPTTIPSCDNIPSPTATDGCGTPTVVCSMSPITQFGCERMRTITWTATDECGNTASCETIYNWTEDTTPPVLSGCPPTEVNLGCNPTTIPTCDVVPSPTATDACGSGEVICADFGITVDGCLRTKTLYWSSIDLCNNDATCETTYTWTEDTTPPVLSGCPPASVNLGCNPTTIPSCANVPSPTATDGCGTPTVVCSETDVMMNGCLRTKTLTWTATDECGNPASCSTLYTWTVDVTPPLLSGCYPTIVNLGCNPTTIPSCDNVPSPTATDACGTPTVTCIASDITAPSTCVRRRTLSWTATDGCGNGATCSTIYTWTVDPPVTLTCPVNTTTAPCLTQDQVNALYNTWLASATFTGGCNATISNNGGTVGPPSACGGTRTVIFTVTGACAPPTSCTATFTVPAPPTVVLTCPTPTIVASCQTQDQVNAQFAAWLASASASGGCNDQLTNNNQGPPSICGGTTTVTFVYTSNCAPLTTTCTSTFTVTAPPTVVLTCPAPMVMSPCSTQAQVNAAYAAWLASATASGGCNGALTNNNTLAAPSICNTGPVTRTITWTYTSSCAPLTTTCTSTFTLPAYPDFTVPASAAATVPCPANATQPVPPVVNNGCGTPIVPTGPVIVNNPNPLTCEGTRTYTWTYTDCAGRARTWSFVYTIERLDFTVPANSGATVDCPDDTDLVPTPPVVLSNCGEVLTPVLINTDAKPLCNGVRRYTWRYTDCEGNSHDWSFVYTVVYQDFTIPPAVNVTKECPQAATVPTPPIVFDNCGKELTPVGPTLGYTYNAFGCEATRTYSYVYKDCSGFSHTWQYAYRFLYEGNFAIFADQYDEVSCEKFAVEPIPPTILDFCGSPTAVWLSNKTEDIDPLGCMGTRTYTFTYRDCGGHSYDWKYTYFIKDDIAPMGDIPNVDEEVACMEDLPCPDDDFSDKMAEIIAEGGFYDNCKEPIAMLDSWTDVTACSDPDGDGVFTFSRTYYFVIKDRCGNAYPELVPVTYWGECQPLGHFSMKDWGIEGGLPASETNGASSDLQVVGLLLSNGGPLKIGGNQRSITLSDAQCVMNMLPGTGGPAVLAHCHQTNCTGGCNPMGIGGLKNALAANAIALELNIRYGVQINLIEGLNVARGTSLECIHLHPCIQDCNAQGVCQLRIFDALGAEYAFPYTVGGLQDLVNLYLNGGLDLSGGLSVIYGTAMNESLELLSSYGNSEMLAALCNGGDDRNLWSDAFDGLDDIDGLDWSPNIKIAPNPASAVFNFRLSRMEQPSDVVLTLYNSLGQVALTQRFDQVQRLNEDIRIDRLNAGVYFLDVKLGGKHHNTKLVIQR